MKHRMCGALGIGLALGLPISALSQSSRPTTAPLDGPGPVTSELDDPPLWTRAGGGSAIARKALPVPAVAFEDLVLLMNNARRAFRGKVQGLPEKPAGYKPPDLKGMTGVVHLTLRSRGVSLAEAESPDMDVVEAAVAAGALLGQAALEKKLAVEDHGDSLGIELEWMGPRAKVDCAHYENEGRWTAALLHAFEPAAEGIGVEFRGQRAWTRPSEVVSQHYSPDLTLAGPEQVIGLKHIHKLRFSNKIRYFRFWAIHLWQPCGGDLPVRLLRGDAYVVPQSLSAETLDAAIQRMGDYLSYRQNSNGGFSQTFLPSADRYDAGNSARVQLRALAGLASYAAWGGRPEVAQGVRTGLDSFSKYLQPLELHVAYPSGATSQRDVGEALMPPGHSGYLEITSRLLSAMLVVPENEPYVEQRHSMLAAILAAQGESGRIAMDPEEADPKRQRSVPPEAGWALLALAQADALDRDAAIEKAIHLGLSFYSDRRTEIPGPTAAAALATAFALHYAQTNDARLSDFVFDTADRLALLQMRPKNCTFPELHGAINVREAGMIGADTALYLGTLAEGLRLANRVGDETRAKVYRQATLAAARFVLQLEVRRPGCYYIRTTRDALGGVRTAPWDNRIRVDHCAQAVESLIQARTALFGPRARPD